MALPLPASSPQDAPPLDNPGLPIPRSETSSDGSRPRLSSDPTSSLVLTSEADPPLCAYPDPPVSSPLKKIKLTASTQLRVEEKVLKRAEITRITRNLKSRIGLASFKTKRGWHNLGFDTIANHKSLPTRSRPIYSSPAKPYIESNDIERAPVTNNPSWMSFSSPLRQGEPRTTTHSIRPHPSILTSPSQSKSLIADSSVLATNSATLMLSPSQVAKLPYSSHGEKGPWAAARTVFCNPAEPNYIVNHDDGDHDFKKSQTPVFSSSLSPGVISSSPPHPLKAPRTPTQKSFHVSPILSHAQAAHSKKDNPGFQRRHQEADLLMYLATSPSPRTPQTQKLSSSHTPSVDDSPGGRVSTGEVVNGGPESPSARPLLRPLSIRANQGSGVVPRTPPNGFNFNDYLNISTPNERNE
ncbi:hypothetical protein NADFUDRAFT_51592 [Nadsonia fulvescens var. elongata DSM 6958]|uniref:Uncharacterized protein n=1 Tax=Nadsonia fulvescens var. elongata DSM 6958 TaxID=857566 RepID=A0A1E3PHV3_9ASCO|nr:hypothetical protein NADFUDRAFT_51592 [Nadsonia fulvescens var. elongata DSM 6958]